MNVKILLVVLFALNFVGSQQLDHANMKASEIRSRAVKLFNEGKMGEVLSYLSDVEKRFEGSLDIGDGIIPSLYAYQGVALYNSQRLEKASAAFKAAVQLYPGDTRAWINLGESYLQRFLLDEAIAAYSAAYAHGDPLAASHILKARGWANSWQGVEGLSRVVEEQVNACAVALKTRIRVGGKVGTNTDGSAIPAGVNCSSSFRTSMCDVPPKRDALAKLLRTLSACSLVDSSSGFEYTFLTGEAQKLGHMKTPNSRASEYEVAEENRAKLWTRAETFRGSRAEGEASRSSEDCEEDEEELAVPGSPSIDALKAYPRPTASANKAPDKNMAHDLLPDPSKTLSFRRLKLGIVSADFGVHPVATLVRGLIDRLDRRKVELFCFSLQPHMSWWGRSILHAAEHFILLKPSNTRDAAAEVAAYDIEILIDLNGHTQYSGLRMMAHRPAPLQVSFLGLPTTTGASFIDYYIGDAQALPPEHVNHFTESIALIPGCYIVNDYAQMHGDMVDFVMPAAAARLVAALASDSSAAAAGASAELTSDDERAHRSVIAALVGGGAYGTRIDLDRESTPYLFGTFSNTQKIDQNVFHVWTNILRRFSGSKMIHIENKGSDIAFKRLRRNAQFYGLKANSIVLLPQAPWIDHLYVKSSIDLLLDTSAKNGHTTGLDGIWAGIPMMSFATGTTMSGRAGQSMLTALGSELGLAYSSKDYEESVYRLLGPGLVKVRDKTFGLERGQLKKSSLSSPTGVVVSKSNNTGIPTARLAGLTYDVRSKRVSSPLFDTPHWTRNFEHLLHAMWELAHINTHGKHFHVVSGAVSKTGPTQVQQVYEPRSDHFSPEVGIRRRGQGLVGGVVMDAEQATSHSPPAKSTPPKPIMPTVLMGGSSGTSSQTTETNAGSNYSLLPSNLFDGRYILLNIGGFTHKEGWYNVNSQSADIVIGGRTVHMNVDIHRMMDDLWGFPDNSVSAIYASHILEHAAHGEESPSQLLRTLREWYRVLRPGGLLMISVPDLPTVFQLYLQPNITLQDRWLLTRVIYGAQSDKYDYHKVGFDESVLTSFLLFPFQGAEQEQASEEQASDGSYNKEKLAASGGFCSIERVGSFNLFSDSSEIVMFGRRISLNLSAKKCKLSTDFPADLAFNINMAGTKYVSPEFPQRELCSLCTSGGVSSATETERGRATNMNSGENGKDSAGEGKDEGVYLKEWKTGMI